MMNIKPSEMFQKVTVQKVFKGGYGVYLDGNLLWDFNTQHCAERVSRGIRAFILRELANQVDTE